ncbi:MAG TPA: class I SAM-dependent methyltransferase [Burkholderiales bacterium]|nr:class I SAM-dependent methyltransferase [Burkholderiales bacterium]
MRFTGSRAMGSVAALALCLSLFATLAPAAENSTARPDFTPSVGQEGKDVIWVPTPQALVERMLQIANVKPTDYVIDLGSGDGRTVITAAKKFGARALGLEYNPDMVELSKRNAQKEGVADRAQFRQADIFASDFSQATVITMYLLPTLNLKLRPTLLNMKPGTRVVSHAFTMDDWEPDQTENVEGRTAYLWIVPAKVEGNWRVSISGSNPAQYDLSLRQRYQKLEGQARNGSNTLQVRDAKVRGDEVVFALANGSGGTQQFTGRLAGDKLEGTVKQSGGEAKWTATRTR